MRIHIKYLSFILLLVASVSCEDYLDKNPLDKPSNETFYSNEAELQMALNACYNYITFVNCVDDATLWPHLPDVFYRDNVTDIAATRLTSIVFQDFKKGELNPNSNLSIREWSWYYVGIGRVNALLDNMVKAEANTPKETYDQIKNEARVIRAICYFNLINDFGDVPLLTKTITIDEALKATRTAKREVLDFIYNELDEAAKNLPDSYDGEDRGRITKGAALAVKARAALYSKDYDIARQAAKSVIDMNVYFLYSDYRNLFTYAGEYSKEIILDYQYKSPERTHEFHMFNAPRNLKGQSQSFPTEDLVASFECTDGLPIDESPLYDPTNPYVNRDPRLHGAIILPRVWNGTDVKTYGTIFCGIEYMSSKEILYDSGKENILPSSLSEKEKKVFNANTNSMITNQEVTNAYSSFTGYCTYKYQDSTNLAAPSSCHNNLILYRYAEILLIYAEASVELNRIDQTVLDALNMVRARAYGNTDAGGVTDISAANYPKITTMSATELRKVIRRERKVELCFEGFRFDDLRRWGLLTKALSLRKNYGRPENYSMLSSKDIPEIDDDGLVKFPYAEDVYGQHGEVRKLRFWEQLGTIPEAYYLLPVPLNEIQQNPNLLQNEGYK